MSYAVDDETLHSDEIVIDDENDDDDEIGDDNFTNNARFKSDLNHLQFQLSFIISIWKDPSTKYSRVSLAILLLTGVGEKPGDLKGCVEGDNVLKLIVV